MDNGRLGAWPDALLILNTLSKDIKTDSKQLSVFYSSWCIPRLTKAYFLV